MSAPWSFPDLIDLKVASRRLGPDHSLARLAAITGRSRQDVDQALWALQGRSVEAAAEVLNRRRWNAA